MNWLNRSILPVLLLTSLLLGSCSAVPVVPAAVVVASQTPAPSVTPPPNVSLTPGATLEERVTRVAQESDDVWDRIVANNKIVVGTAWDYPPFAYVDANFQVVGFDIALIQEIGQRLNIPVEIQNFTFDGLPVGLQINQIDLAIGAISISPERSNLVSFSPVYYVNQTAVVGRNDSKVSITDFKQLAGYKVGVQRGTTYESLMKNQLVETGLMSADKLLSYAQADEAIRDLLAKRVDLVVIGQATATYFSSQNGLKVVGSGFGQQDLALAMRLKTPRLKAEIDRVMDTMLTDGTILELIQKYGETEVGRAFPTQYPPKVSTPTPVLPAVTVTPPACVDGMQFVSDVTLEDNDMRTPALLNPGEAFVKIWRVANSGTCTWTSKYRLVYAYGNVSGAQMNGQPVSLPGNVIPGQTIDLSVKLTAPRELTTYQGFWQMENAAGVRFGQTIWVGITTLSGNIYPTVTAQPANVDACLVTLKAPKYSITVKTAFDAVWTVKNTSGTDWNQTSTDYKFISGTEMHDNANYDFTQTIENGESGEIIVDMLAPATPGIYNTKWAIISGSKTLCTLNLSLSVISK